MNLEDWRRRIALTLGIQPDPTSPSGFFGRDAEGGRCQVNVRRLTRGDHLYRRISRPGDTSAFEILIVVLLDEAATEVRHAWRVPSAVVTDFAHRTTDGVGWWIRMTEALRADPRVDDISVLLGGVEAPQREIRPDLSTLDDFSPVGAPKRAGNVLPRERSRESIPPRLRFEVLRRDGFRCTYCGRTADDGVKLHIDHLEPLAEGGRTVADNLVTACDTCNLGKGARPIL